jgi:hypothetical protein
VTSSRRSDIITKETCISILLLRAAWEGQPPGRVGANTLCPIKSFVVGGLAYHFRPSRMISSHSKPPLGDHYKDSTPFLVKKPSFVPGRCQPQIRTSLYFWRSCLIGKSLLDFQTPTLCRLLLPPASDTRLSLLLSFEPSSSTSHSRSVSSSFV